MTLAVSALVLTVDALPEGCGVFNLLALTGADHESLRFIGIGKRIDGLFLHLGAFTLSSKDLINELWLAFEFVKGLFRSLLLTFLLGKAITTAARHSFKQYLVAERRTSILILATLDKLKLHLHLVLLSPLYELALEVDFLISNLIDVYHLGEDAILQEMHAGIIAAVEIEGTDKRLKSITA